MKIGVIGGGPAGLFLAIQMKLHDPCHQVVVHERNARGNTFGWGVVFSDGTLDNLRAADPATIDAIDRSLVRWDDIDVVYRGRVVRSGGHGFSGLSRWRLLDVLADRALELGVEVQYESEVEAADLGDADLVVAADGIHSRTREEHAAHFQPDIDVRRCRYVWLGTRKAFEAFTFYFVRSVHGWYQAHCYQFDGEWSTFIVETPEEVWRADGLDRMDTAEAVAFCEALFAEHLGGEALVSNATHLRGSAAWLAFPRVSCGRWHHGRLVLLGDAAATAHYSIGSGTKLAMESAVSLARHLHATEDLDAALDAYEAERRLEVLRLQSAARNSTEWFEEVGTRAHLEPEQLTYSLVTRSQRVSHENLRLRDRAWLEDYERWFARRATGGSVDRAVPPMFLPLRLRELELVNRVAVSPMAMYSAVDGTVGDFHLVHLGSRAMGGAGLVFTEMTCVSADGRITPGCAGLYADEHVEAWRRVVDFVHGHSQARIALQLGHAGRKGATTVPWEGDEEPLSEGAWPLIAPSPMPWTPRHQVPAEMSRADMERVRDDFVTATLRAVGAGFDMVEVHCAHGYLLSSFISPLTNRREDAWGGTLEGRMRFPLEVVRAVRAAWPRGRPLSVRISATDWVEGGIRPRDAVAIARLLAEADVDVVDVSAGQVVPEQQPVYGRMFQTPFAERVRQEGRVATMAVGNIYEPDHVNGIIGAGRADLCLLARPHLWDPHWTLRAAADLGVHGVPWPPQYLSGKAQLERLAARARELAAEEPI